MMLAALTMPVMIGAAGLASDTVSWALIKRQLQRQADSAALAGAYALSQAKDAGDAARHDITVASDVQLSATPTIITPTSGPYAGNANAVQVTLASTPMLPFSSLVQASPEDELTSVLARLGRRRPLVTVWREGELLGVVPEQRLMARLKRP